MNLTDTQKEMLGFMFARIGNRALATISMRELQQHFAEVHAGNFWELCSDLLGKDLIINSSADLVSLTRDGWQIAHALQGKPALRSPRTPEPAAPPSEHLVWDLSRMADYKKAQNFAMNFQKSLCVYSPPVEQLYTTYDVLVPQESTRKLIILPDPKAHHDTFSFINADACSPTGVYLVPTIEGGLMLKLPATSGGWLDVAPAEGFRRIQEKLGPGEPFLPVLTKGDLRELSPSQPAVHLHRLTAQKIRGRSEMDMRAMRRAIQEKMAEHFGFQAASGLL